MISRNLYFLDGVLFATSYERVVVGARGAYVECTKDQIKVKLISKYNQELPDNVSNEPFYYYWLFPEGRDEKVYWQVRTVNYADYKIGYYYISPKLLIKLTIKNCFKIYKIKYFNEVS
jgi:hypothetical protein